MVQQPQGGVLEVGGVGPVWREPPDKEKAGISPNETKDLISNATDCLKKRRREVSHGLGAEGGGLSEKAPGLCYSHVFLALPG